MKNWKNILPVNFIRINIFILFIFLNHNIYSKEIDIEIIGNKNTDKEVIYSILDKFPEKVSIDYSNYLLKKINDSNLFEEVSVEIINDKYVVYVKEYPTINNIYFRNNKRLKDDDLILIAKELNLNKISDNEIQNYIFEVSEIYRSLGFNSIVITTNYEINESSNSSDVYFIFDEGKLTKIKKVYFTGNKYFDNESLFNIIKSKNKSLKNIFANNNYKLFQIQNDIIKINNFYKNNGFVDIHTTYEVEFLKNDKVNIFFNIDEGEEYKFKKIDFNNKLSINNITINDEVTSYIISRNLIDTNYSLEKIENIEKNISSIIQKNGVNFFEIKKYEKKENNQVSLLFEILSAKPKYINQINITGNYRTYDYVIRRELIVSEGDPLNKQQLKSLNKKINSLNLFKNIKITENKINDELIDLNINLDEKQTGSFNAGFSFGSLDGAAFTTGLNEKNFGGTGKSVDFLINTSDDSNTFKLSSSEPHFYNYDINFNYGFKYNQEDFSSSKSYKLDVYELSSGFNYEISEDLFHNINLSYESKDYIVTNSSTASDTILKSQGKNVSFLLKNKLILDKLNSYMIPTNGEYISFLNTIETPTSSTNGFVKNELTLKRFYKNNRSIYSIQSRFGNIFSINVNEILSDNKFSLGGRWLRGFDNYGAGPRNSRTSYVGGRNLFVTKLDYQYSLMQNDNPIFFNIFNDYGMLWDNKNTPTYSDQSLRASYGFGIKFYSPIGPIGFSWGFPLIEKNYDIKRMFLFSIGNIN